MLSRFQTGHHMSSCWKAKVVLKYSKVTKFGKAKGDQNYPPI